MATKPSGLDWTEPSSTFVGEYPMIQKILKQLD